MVMDLGYYSLSIKDNILYLRTYDTFTRPEYDKLSSKLDDSVIQKIKKEYKTCLAINGDNLVFTDDDKNKHVLCENLSKKYISKNHLLEALN